ncbi:MAG: hypothetical protein ACRBFS_11655 [Aureispira sp.]
MQSPKALTPATVLEGYRKELDEQKGCLPSTFLLALDLFSELRCYSVVPTVVRVERTSTYIIATRSDRFASA